MFGETYQSKVYNLNQQYMFLTLIGTR